MELKIHRAIYFLYAIAIVQIANIFYFMIKLIANVHGQNQVPPLDISNISTFIAETILGAFILVGTVVAIRGLKKESSLGWGLAIALFFLTIPTCALPVSVMGLKCLLSEDVRDYFVGVTLPSENLIPQRLSS